MYHFSSYVEHVNFSTCHELALSAIDTILQFAIISKQLHRAETWKFMNNVLTLHGN